MIGYRDHKRLLKDVRIHKKSNCNKEKNKNYGGEYGGTGLRTKRYMKYMAHKTPYSFIHDGIRFLSKDFNYKSEPFKLNMESNVHDITRWKSRKEKSKKEKSRKLKYIVNP